MGNSSTKEHGAGRNPSRHVSAEVPGGSSESPDGHPAQSSSQAPYGSRAGRTSRPDLSVLLGINNAGDRDITSLETRRETKQEREARRAEKERVARERERERSMREEHVDGGYLVTQGVYTGVEDYNKGIVRQFMVLNPFSQVHLSSNVVAVGETHCALLARPQRPFRVLDGASAGCCCSR